MLLQEPLLESLRTNDLLSKISQYVKAATLPVLLAVIPTFYHYSNNVVKLTTVSLYRMVLFNTVLAILIYVVCLFFTRFQAIRAASAAFIFLIFFNIYGILYRYLLQLDVITIKHYTLLPFIIMLAIYAILFIVCLNDSILAGLWKNFLLMTGVLVLFNLVNIVPAEIKRSQSDVPTERLTMQMQVPADKMSPDIYYIILDEFEGFQGMREYWHYQGVDEFASFLKEGGFFVAEASHGSSIDTLHQMASRLNYREYPLDDEHTPIYFRDMADNQVVHFLKSRGYNIVVFDETNMGYASAKPMQADYLYEYGSSSIPQGSVGNLPLGFEFDEFGKLIIDNTMLYAISQTYKRNDPMILRHRNMVFFTVENIASSNVPSPKFVHVHLLLPHMPFMFNEQGDLGESSHYYNWDYYLDNYKFSIKVTEKMVKNILQASDPNRPPVIIIQSDHGARNLLVPQSGSKQLYNYPEKYKTLILNAMYIPGYDTSKLTQDIDPINTFPILFNYLFRADIPLIKEK